MALKDLNVNGLQSQVISFANTSSCKVAYEDTFELLGGNGRAKRFAIAAKSLSQLRCEHGQKEFNKIVKKIRKETSKP